MNSYESRIKALLKNHDVFIEKENSPTKFSNGWYQRYTEPILTGEHAPIHWRYDLNEKTNPFLIERIGINATLNSGAIKWNDKYIMVVRVEGVDRKSFFAIAESPNGIDNFRFWDYAITMPETNNPATNIYDMRLIQHEDG